MVIGGPTGGDHGVHVRRGAAFRFPLLGIGDARLALFVRRVLAAAPWKAWQVTKTCNPNLTWHGSASADYGATGFRGFADVGPLNSFQRFAPGEAIASNFSAPEKS